MTKCPVPSALHTPWGAGMWLVGLPGCPMARRLRRRGTKWWRRRRSQTVERAGQGQRGWRVLRSDPSFCAPPGGCRRRASRIASTIRFPKEGPWRPDHETYDDACDLSCGGGRVGGNMRPEGLNRTIRHAYTGVRVCWRILLPFLVKWGAQRMGDLSPQIMCTNLAWSDRG